MWWPWKKKRDLPEHLRTGEWGEEVAAQFLKSKGFKVVGRRVKLGRDEIDILAMSGEVLVFVEVKTRKSEDFGRAASAVDKRKRQILSRAAFHYLRKLRARPTYFRFDVVEVVGEIDKPDPVIRHIENAFTLDRRYRLPW
jgi:putative endonuclease